MKIAIIGYGNVGKKIAGLLEQAGQQVIIGSSHATPDNENYLFMDVDKAIANCDTIVLCIPYNVAIEFLTPRKDALKNKIVVDATNPLDENWQPLLLGQENSAGESIQALLTQTKVVKAFNTIFADIMDTQSLQKLTTPLAAFIASDHHDAKNHLVQIMQNIGFNTVDVGPIKMARYLEAMAHLNIQIAVGQGGGTKAGFAYIR